MGDLKVSKLNFSVVCKTACYTVLIYCMKQDTACKKQEVEFLRFRILLQ